MCKIYIILFLILTNKNFVLCMEQKDSAPKTSSLENLWQVKFDRGDVVDEFLGDELIEIMRSAVQFVYSIGNLSRERKKAGKDSACLGKNLLSASLFYNIGDAIDKMLALYNSLFELENKNPIIAKTLKIKCSFSSSFCRTAEDIFRNEHACLYFGSARIKLINSMKRLQYLVEYISIKIVSVKGADEHLKILGMLRDMALKFQNEISLRKLTFRSKLRSGQSRKICKQIKSEN